MKNYLLLLAFLAAATVFSEKMAAQTTLISDAVSIRNDRSYELIGRLRGKYLLFRDRFDEFEVVAFDQRLQFSWDKSIDLDKRGAEILAVYSSKNDFSVLFKARKKGGDLALRLHKFDPEANLIDSITLKTWKTTPFSSPRLEVVISENRNCIAVLDVAEKASIGAFVLKIDQMRGLWDKTILLENDFLDNGLEDFALSDEGDLALIFEKNNRRGRVEEHQIVARQYSATGEFSTEIPFPDFLSYDVDFEFDNLNHRLAGAGLFGEKNAERADGFFYVAIPNGQTKVEAKREPFGDQFLSILKGREVEKDAVGLDDADVRRLIFRKDGGAALICERNHEITRGTSSGASSRFSRDAGRLVIDHYYDDFFVISIGPDGRSDWKTILNKKQYSQDDDAAFSSFLAVKTADRLRFLFNDEVRFENSCSEYVVGADGKFDRNSVLNTAEQGLRLRFRDGLQLSENEVLVPSEWRGKLRLALIRLN